MKKLILASGSPRRRELLEAMGLEFGVAPRYGVEESWPEGMAAERVPVWLARLKSEAYPIPVADDEVVLTADTVVISDGAILGKPRDGVHAAEMLRRLSGRTHSVVTAVCLRESGGVLREFSATTRVTFRELTEREIERYAASGMPLDKAGAYGIQEWIGLVGVRSIEGSYTNVVGLPAAEVWEALTGE